jgi:tetratricopeptide (TPR) repeat protein
MNDSQSAASKLESGETARREQRLTDSKADFAAAAAWYEAHGPVQMQVHSLTRQAQIERDLGSYDAAIEFQQKALQLQREIGREGLPHVVRHLADILDDAGRHQEASPYYAEMESLYRNSPETPPLEMANAVRSLAVHSERVGDKERARQLWLEARELYSKLDQLFLDLTGDRRNPGVEEAEKRLALL